MTDSIAGIKQARRRAAPQLRFGDYVRIARREMRLSQEQFAARLGVRTATVSAWESGRNTPDDLPEVASRLELVTGYARQWFLGWGDIAPAVGGMLAAPDPFAGASQTESSGATINLDATTNSGWTSRLHLRSRPSGPKSLIRRELHAVA